MKKILLFIYGLLLVGLNVLYAQTPTITGKVTAAEDGSPIPGVSVVVKGTSRGTVTNENGDYTIQASSNQTLVYSFIGSITQEIEVGLNPS